MTGDNPSKPKVVSLRGSEITLPGEPVPAVVEALEKLLEAAQSGDVQGFAVAVMHADSSTSTRRAGIHGRALVGALEIVKLDLAAEVR